MNVAAVFISDRQDQYLPGCLDSFNEHVEFRFPSMLTIDDSAHRLGMAGAVRAGWEWALSQGCDYLLHLEEDFRFNERCPLTEMLLILEEQPHLAQIVLKRQPWSVEEKQAGGIIEMHPDDYTQCTGDALWWVEHQRIFSLNPCLIPRRVLELGWPDGNEAEFTRRCLDAGYSFAFYGSLEDPPLVTHVGEHRSFGWRL